ncbi:efflux RND transporter periplasmic adaptor subunit [Flexithrix dorotheae]|uniref:efflux RND transporter periplasmic adaptor subunit n=1 Tax=Flexithrix dorotheae TaxID=70993 RepID=UPI000364B4CA|nr:efflux RND transporter periplasmic adaptor subunit [Flexithrix dorotheae]
MKLKLNKKTWFTLGGAALFLIFFLSWKVDSPKIENILVKPEKGDFEIVINSTGELEAKNSTPINGPGMLRSARIYSVKIEDIVDEGTIVKKGDYVATLDRTEIAERIRNEELNVEESLNRYEQVQLDTALELREARDVVAKAKLNVERKEIALKKSAFEPPAAIEEAELAVKEAQMDYLQAVDNYELKFQRAQTQVKRRLLDLVDDQKDAELLHKLSDEFSIIAPQNGMVIYIRHRGVKMGKGSSMSTYNLSVANLPDLSKMNSKTYINEIDINKISVGQKVKIGIDAFPEKRLSGKVVNIANIGESLPNSDAKVFEVIIELTEEDTTLRPGMTTSNEIIADKIPNVVYLPLECLHNLDDSINYVFKKTLGGIVKQEVVAGKTNSNEVIITKGVSEEDEILLSTPAYEEDYKLKKLD